MPSTSWKVYSTAPNWVYAFNSWLKMTNDNKTQKLSDIRDGQEISDEDWEGYATAFDYFERSFAMEPALRLIRKQ